MADARAPARTTPPAATAEAPEHDPGKASDGVPSGAGGATDALPWTLFCASLAGLALLVAWSVRHPVRAVASAPIVAAETPAAELATQPSATVPPTIVTIPVPTPAPAPAPELGPGPQPEPGAEPESTPVPDSIPAPTSASASPRESVEVVAAPDPVPGVVVAATGGGGVAVGEREAEPVAVVDPTGDEPARGGPTADGTAVDGSITGEPDGAARDGTAPDTVPDVATLRRDEELATLAGLSARLGYVPGETVPGATGAAALARMVELLARHPALDVVVSVTGREPDASPAGGRALARARAAHVVDRFVEAGLRRGRFLIRVEPGVGEALTSGHRVRVTALVDGA